MQFASLILRILHGINLDRYVRYVRLDGFIRSVPYEGMTLST